MSLYQMRDRGQARKARMSFLLAFYLFKFTSMVGGTGSEILFENRIDFLVMTFFFLKYIYFFANLHFILLNQSVGSTATKFSTYYFDI